MKLLLSGGIVGAIPQSLLVWAKPNAGMGSLYRSQHELLPLFKKGKAPHINNVELGKNGRWRSNVWTYPGASSLGSEAREGLQHHLSFPKIISAHSDDAAPTERAQR